jgi:predicted nucleic-acid-binding protein
VVAVDTNVLIRLITKDHAAQVARAVRLFQTEQVWVAKTVLLETDWVLRSLYGFDAQDVGAAFRKLAGLSSVELQDPSAVAQALSWRAAGIDFADGLHLASRGEANSFATFDERFAKRTATLSVVTFDFAAKEKARRVRLPSRKTRAASS